MAWLALPILLVAFALRVWHLSVQSFWWDEAYSAMVASEGLRTIVATLAREDFHPPLHYFILHFWLPLAGRSELALRFVSVSAGVLTVAAAWTTAKRLLGRSAAPIAALIFTLSPFLWYYSQETRMFALVPLFGTLALYFCARAVEDDQRWPWIVYTTMVTLGLYDLYYAIFLPFICGFWIFLTCFRATPVKTVRALSPLHLRWRGAGGEATVPLRGWAIATLVAFVLYVPWMPIFLFRNSVWASAFEPENGPAKVIVWSWPEFVLGLPTLSLYQQILPAALLGLAALTSVAALGHAWHVSRRRPTASLPALVFLVTFLTIAAISAIKPVFHPRYAIPVVVGLYLTLAGLIDDLLTALSPSPRIPSPSVGEGIRGEGDKTRLLLGVAVCLLLVACAGYGFEHLVRDPTYARDDYRDAIAYVQRAGQPTDTVIDNAIPPFWYYYHGQAPASYFPTGTYTEAVVATELTQVTLGHPRLWYVQHAAIPNDPDGFVDAQLRQHSTQLDEHWFGAIRVQLWQIPPGTVFAATRFLPVSANFADQLTLAGYATSGEVGGGHTIDVELQWKVQRPLLSDDGFWVSLNDTAGRSWGRADSRPRDATYSLSSAWPVGETVVTRFDLPIDVGTPPNHYQLIGGVYRLSDLTGLDVLDSNQHPIGQQVKLGPLDVIQPTEGSTDPTLPDQLGARITPALTLAADQISRTTLAPGDQLPVTLLWHANAALPPLQGSLRLQSPNGQIISQDDRPIGDAFPTDRWAAGELIREQRELKVPASAPAGPAALELVLSSGQSILLGSATIVTVTRDFTPPSTSHPLRASLGDTVSLVGYDLSGDRAKPGDQIDLTLDWKDVRAASVSYHVFVHLLDRRDHIWAQWDGVPKNWSYPTSAWIPGEYVVDHYPLKLSSQTPIGTLTLEVGLYDAATGKRLPVIVSSGDSRTDRIVLQSIQITR